jgi:hypothetical protein
VAHHWTRPRESGSARPGGSLPSHEQGSDFFFPICCVLRSCLLRSRDLPSSPWGAACSDTFRHESCLLHCIGWCVHRFLTVCAVRRRSEWKVRESSRRAKAAKENGPCIDTPMSAREALGDVSNLSASFATSAYESPDASVSASDMTSFMTCTGTYGWLNDLISFSRAAPPPPSACAAVV